MSVFSDLTLKRHLQAKTIIIDPFNEKNVQPTSYDLTLSGHFKFISEVVPNSVFRDGHEVIDPFDIPSNLYVDLPYTHGYIIQPREFLLGSTIEKVDLANSVVARVEGKSSLGRLGLSIHTTAGFIDPGFRGNITLEMYNFSPRAIKLTAGMKVAQICLMTTTTPVEKPYGSKGLGSRYQDSVGTIGSGYGDTLAES